MLALSSALLIAASADGLAQATEDARLIPINVIGADDRRPAGVDDTALMRAVGMIACSRPGQARPLISRATGTVVGNRRTVLTAAHVFAETDRFGGAVKFDPVSECSFRHYDTAGDLLVEARFRSVAFGGFRHNAGLPTEDWAVLQTTQALPAALVPLPFAALELEELEGRRRVAITVLAFHADARARRRLPLLSEGDLFAVDYAGFRRLAHTADMGRMSSGAAIVHRTADGAAVVLGIHRSAATFGDYNLAVPITGALEQALMASASGRVPGAGQRMAQASVAARLGLSRFLR